MKQPTFEMQCDVCGGGGLGTIEELGAQWNADISVVHSDPNTCRYHLSKQKEKMQQEREHVQA